MVMEEAVAAEAEAEAEAEAGRAAAETGLVCCHGLVAAERVVVCRNPPPSPLEVPHCLVDYSLVDYSHLQTCL
jgi:hypothetical protein